MTTPPPPSGDDDARDPRVAAWLAVEPLDDVTRARLVREALAGSADDGTAPADDPEAPPAGRRRLGSVLAVAAVLVALMVVAAAVLTSRGTDSTTTAADAPRSKAAPESSRSAGSTADAAPDAALAPAGEAPGAPLVLRDLGDLGDVSTADRLRSTVSGALSVPAGTATTTVAGCASDAGQAFGTPVAAGTGRVRGRPATVVVATGAGGSTAAVAVAGRDCADGVSAILP